MPIEPTTGALVLALKWLKGLFGWVRKKSLTNEEREILMAINTDHYQNLVEFNTAQLGSFLGNNTRKFIDMADPEMSRKKYLEAAEKLAEKGHLSQHLNASNAKVYELTSSGISLARKYQKKVGGASPCK